jgi:hypothetical protein
VRVEQRPKRATAAIVAWRRSQLVAAGFEATLATDVARDADYDLHALLELVERGCAPPLAVRIHAPLERRPGEPR